jgi:hypothetical protein
MGFFNTFASALGQAQSFNPNQWQAYVTRLSPAGVAGLDFLTQGPWRPPLWGTQPQLVSLTITIPGVPSTNVSTEQTVGGVAVPTDASIGNAPTTQEGTPSRSTTYYFDAILRLDHIEDVIITSHPVQDGASISDNAYIMPARVSLEAKFSDAQQSYQVNQYSGGTTKSVAAYQAFKSIKDKRLPCTLATRLNTYSNILIEGISAHETRDTVYALHLTMRLRQILVAVVATNEVSARPDQNNSNNEGTKAPTPTPQNLQYLQDLANPNQWKSNNLPNLLPPSN